MHKASWIANKRRLRSSRACLLATVNSFALRFFHAYQTYVFLRYVEIYQLPDQFVFEYGVFAANLPGSEQVFQLLQFCQQFEQCAEATAGETFRSSSTINLANNDPIQFTTRPAFMRKLF